MALNPIQILINAKDEASAVFGRLQTKVAAVGVAIAGYFGIKTFGSAVKSAADFEAAMSRVEAATGASGAELKALEKAASDAGANTKFKAVEAAAALENLAKAGLDTTQSIKTLGPVLNLAAAADVELATAAEYVTKAVMGMGLSFDDAGRVADVLAMGASATNTSVAGLAQSLSYAAPIAQSVGLTLEQTTAIMGKMADAGIDASRSGTSLANILAQFSDPSSAFKKELAALGITTNDFNEALRQLEAAGDKGKNAIQSVGLNAGPALQSLINQGMGSVDSLSQKLRDAGGSAAEAAKVMQNNFNGSIDGLESSWENLKKALAAPVLPVLTQGINDLATAFRASVSDGTIGRFGQIIKTAFENGIQGVKTFIASFDVEAIIAKFQSWAASAGDTFTKITQYAQTAGGVVQVVWGAMSTGANVVMAVIYKVAEAFAGVASNVQAGLAVLYEGMSKITFGPISAAYKKAADEIRISAGATGAVTQAFADQAAAAFDRAAGSAETLRAGFGALAADATPTAEAAKTVAAAADTIAQSAENAAQAQDNQTQAAIKNKAAAEDNAAAIQLLLTQYADLVDKGDLKAAEAVMGQVNERMSAGATEAKSSAQAIATLRQEYDVLIAKGDLQAAVQKLQEINQQLHATDGASAAARAGIATVGDAFKLLGITSTEAMRNTAKQSRAAYDVIRDSGTASARDVREAFRVAAQSAIDAADGIAPAWVQAEAAQRGYVVQVDESGKSVLKLASEIKSATTATGNLQGAWRGVGSAIDSAVAKAKQLGTDGEEIKDQISAANGGSFSAQAYAQQAKDVQELDAWWEQWSADYARKNAKLGGTSISMSRYWFEVQKAQYENARRDLEMQDRIQQSAEVRRGNAGTGAAGQSGGGATYVSNITLPGGGGTRQLRFADAASQSAAEQLLRELAQAKGAAS